MDAALFNQTNTSYAVSSHQKWILIHLSVLFFFIVGILANCLSLYGSWMLIRKGNSVAVYLVNLSISDLLSTITLSLWIEMDLQEPVDAPCSVVSLIVHSSFYISSGLLCCISVDRYLAVVYPLRFHWVREVRTATAVSIAVWTLDIAIHIILLGHTGALQPFFSRGICEERIPMTQEDAKLVLTGVILGFLVPVFIMTFCCQQIMRSLGQSTSILTTERRKVRQLLLFLNLTYFVAFAPYQTVMLLRFILEPGASVWAKRLRTPHLFTAALTILNSTLDPIIYCLVSKGAQDEIRKAREKCLGVLVRRK